MAGFAGDPFANMKNNETRTFGSFTGQQVGAPAAGGVTVIRGIPSASSDIDNWLMRGYALKDAVSAVAAATSGDKIKTDTALAPAESAAKNALTSAQATVQNTTAQLMPAESTARIAGINADIGLTGAQAADIRKNRLETTTLPALAPVMGASPIFRLSDIISRR